MLCNASLEATGPIALITVSEANITSTKDMATSATITVTIVIDGKCEQTQGNYCYWDQLS